MPLAISSEDTAPMSIRMPKVLFVDDDPTLLRAYNRRLSGQLEIVTTETADEAVKLLNSGRFDLIVADYNMPVRNGVWLLEQVAKHAPQVLRILSSGEYPESLEEYLSTGLVEHFLLKPTLTDEILACIQDTALQNRVRSSRTRTQDTRSPGSRENQDVPGLDVTLTPDDLTAVFQPIFETSDETYHLYGLECLIRGPKNTSIESPVSLFELPRRNRREPAADRTCIVAILRTAADLPKDTRLSINLHASTLASDPEFISFFTNEAEKASISPSRLTIEIVEYAPDWIDDSFVTSLEDLRSIGIKIAVDDVGAGDSNYRKIMDCRPDFIKIDRYFVHGCNKDKLRQAVLESIAVLAARLDSRIVAEGVEEPADLEFVRSLEIDLIQGFLFARPMSIPALEESGYLQCAEIPLPSAETVAHMTTQSAKGHQ